MTASAEQRRTAETHTSTNRPEYTPPKPDVEHRAALDANGQLAATDLEVAAHRRRRPEPEVIMPSAERRGERKSLLEKAVGERTDVSAYIEKYILSKTDSLPKLFDNLRRAGMQDTLDSCYKVLIAMGANIMEDPRTREPVGIDIPAALKERLLEKHETPIMPVDKLWNKARVLETEVRAQNGETFKVQQLELSVSLDDWWKVSPKNPQNPQNREAAELAKDIEVFLKTTTMADTGCKDAPMKWYLTLDEETVSNDAHSMGIENRLAKIFGEKLDKDAARNLLSETGLTRRTAVGLKQVDAINDIFGLSPPKDGSWTVIEGHHGFTGDGALMKKPLDRMAYTLRQNLLMADALKHAVDMDDAVAAPKPDHNDKVIPILHKLTRAIDRQEGTEKKRKIWTVVVDGMGINDNIAPDEVRNLNPDIADTYGCYGKQIDLLSSLTGADIVAGWSMGGYGVVRALSEKLKAAQLIKGSALTQEDVDSMKLPFVESITPAFAETCWFSMITPSQKEELLAAGQTTDSVVSPLDQYIDSTSPKARVGFLASRSLLTIGSIMHLVGGPKRQPLKGTFEFFSKLYCGKIFPKDARLTSDEQWIQESAIGHARGFTKDGNGKALKWQRDAINNTVRMNDEELALLKLARGNLVEFVGNQDLLVRDKDLWREINDQALGAPAYELPAGHALLGQDCFQEFPFGIGVMFSGKERRLIFDMATNLSTNEAAGWLHRLKKTVSKTPAHRTIVNQYLKYSAKYHARQPGIAAS